jgi:hypothetical protein
MTRDEFITLHGEPAWERLVRPLQDNPCRCECCRVRANNANAIVHHDVLGVVLDLLGRKDNSLVKLKDDIDCLIRALKFAVSNRGKAERN